ncbi:MAG: DUF4189 domain-containing protein [Betaproteobacteria bacterium]|nr:DUF4189 domain-containing protein [Betaproteobacteria bacterium]
MLDAKTKVWLIPLMFSGYRRSISRSDTISPLYSTTVSSSRISRRAMTPLPWIADRRTTDRAPRRRCRDLFFTFKIGDRRRAVVKPQGLCKKRGLKYIDAMLRFLLGLAIVASPLALSSYAAMATTDAKKPAKGRAHGAIAGYAETGRVGYSYDFPNARAANVAALNECAHQRCEVMISIANECGAIAKGPKGHAAKKGSTQAEAETRALNACGKDCRPVAWARTR